MAFSLACLVPVLVHLKHLVLVICWDLDFYCQFGSSSGLFYVVSRLLPLHVAFPCGLSLWLSSMIARLLTCKLRAPKSIKAEATRPFENLRSRPNSITSATSHWLKTSPDPRDGDCTRAWIPRGIVHCNRLSQLTF